jgi:hypothetical protein
MKTAIPQSLILALIVCLGSLQNTHAVVPPPDGGYPNFTTAEGQNALKDLTTGAANTALGAYSMFATTTGSFNTAVGAGALDLNTGDENTAVGVAALLLNTGTNNTAVGVDALGLNTTGASNAAVGAFALYNNTTGGSNTAIGYNSLFNNTTGVSNVAIGFQTLLFNTIGSSNIALGDEVGSNIVTGNNNIDIGGGGVGDESNTIRIGNDFISATYIAGINGATASGGTTVFIDHPELIAPGIRAGTKLGAFLFLARMVFTGVPNFDRWEREHLLPSLNRPLLAHENPAWRAHAQMQRLYLLDESLPVRHARACA